MITNEYREENNEFYSWLEENIEQTNNEILRLEDVCLLYLGKKIGPRAKTKFKKEIERLELLLFFIDIYQQKIEIHLNNPMFSKSMHGTKFVKIVEATKFFGVCHRTIYRWRDTGKIGYRKKPSGHFVYEIPDTSSTPSPNTKIKVIYVRVSSRKQADDLQRQKQFLQNQFLHHQVITDIGSGLNFKRPGFIQLLQLVIGGNVEEIVVSSKDRLCRFGFELVEWLCLQHNTKLVVQQSDQKPSEQEFVYDVLSIIQIYTCKWNGRRRYTCQSQKSKITIDINTEKTLSTMEQSC